MNPTLDQERVEFLIGRISGAKLQLLPQWMRPEKELPVISLPTDWVRFSTLNHRTRAEQLRESGKTGNQLLFSEDPLGEEAQAAQFNILSAQQGFQDLKADLKARSQQEPAIVTAEGVLINGNRRAAAMRDLWIGGRHELARYIRAIVLPQDATPDELIDLETELQVAKEFREDYSWVNEALLVEEIFDSSNKNWDSVSSRMRLEPARARAQYDKLQQLRQLVAISNGARYLADFIANESAFDELAKHIKDKSAEEAAAVRNVYFMGTLSGVNYRDLRNLRRKDCMTFVDAEFAEDSILTALIDTVQPAAVVPHEDLLDEVLGEDLSQGGSNLSSILSFIAGRKMDEMVVIPEVANHTVRDVTERIATAITAAAKEASEDAKDERAVLAPTRRINEACVNVDRATQALARARASKEWDELSYEKALARLKLLVDAIGKIK